MISDNHNAYNNYNNYIDEYELTNGYAVVDRNFSIVTANHLQLLLRNFCFLECQNIIQLWMLFIRLTLMILLMLPTV